MSFFIFFFFWGGGGGGGGGGRGLVGMVNLLPLCTSDVII